MAILALYKARSRRESNPVRMGADRREWCDDLPESLHESCTRGRHIVVMKLIWWLGHFERDGHTVQQAQSKASHCQLTSPSEDWLLKDAQEGLLWPADTLHQGHIKSSRGFQNVPTFFGQPSFVCVCTRPWGHYLEYIYIYIYIPNNIYIYIPNNGLRALFVLRKIHSLFQSQFSEVLRPLFGIYIYSK